MMPTTEWQQRDGNERITIELMLLSGLTAKRCQRLWGKIPFLGGTQQAATSVPVGPHRTPSDPIGPRRTPSIPVGPRRSPLVAAGCRWLQLVWLYYFLFVKGDGDGGGVVGDAKQPADASPENQEVAACFASLNNSRRFF